MCGEGRWAQSQAGGRQGRARGELGGRSGALLSGGQLVDKGFQVYVGGGA